MAGLKSDDIASLYGAAIWLNLQRLMMNRNVTAHEDWLEESEAVQEKVSSGFARHLSALHESVAYQSRFIPDANTFIESLVNHCQCWTKLAKQLVKYWHDVDRNDHRAVVDRWGGHIQLCRELECPSFQTLHDGLWWEWAIVVRIEKEHVNATHNSLFVEPQSREGLYPNREHEKQTAPIDLSRRFSGVEVPHEDSANTSYRRVWGFVSENWSPGSDHYQLIELLKCGRVEYRVAVDTIWKGISRTHQNRAFNNLKNKKINKSIEHLGVELVREPKNYVDFRDLP